MKVAIVILNWNGKKLLEQFLPSVIEYSKTAEIYVADNDSQDDSIAYMTSNFPSVKIIKNDKNYGYAEGYNKALRQISADILCLLNNDVEVTKNWISPIIETFNNEPSTAIIQPKILSQKNKDLFDYAGAAGGFIDKFGFPYCKGRIFNTIESDLDQYNENSQIFWASGASFFIKTKVFKELGGFDKHFFAHMEEIDLCWRAFNNNFNVKYEAKSVVYHVGGATLNQANPKKTYLNFSNSLVMLYKNLPKEKRFNIILTRLLLDGVAGARFFFQLKPRHTLAVINAHFNFYSNLPRLLKQRKPTFQRKKYYHKTSIVWCYFIIGKRTFKSL